jgi:predicted ArsR family transcriptional regulator
VAEIIQINNETLLGFVKRRGTVSSVEVAHRFGWPLLRARHQLETLEKHGYITSELAPLDGGGMVKNWSAVVPCLT